MVPSLIVFGGDTLRGVAEAMRWLAFRARGELLPGVAACQPEAEHPAPLVVSKPGGFGSEQTLVELLRKLAPLPSDLPNPSGFDTPARSDER
jgi:uncharacterized protein YgbK (DUF1537 family)